MIAAAQSFLGNAAFPRQRDNAIRKLRREVTGVWSFCAIASVFRSGLAVLGELCRNLLLAADKRVGKG
jgi:hypothetical protein